MKILWVKAGGLIPLDTGGKIRSYQILKELAHKHEVTLYTFYGEHADDAHPQLERLFAHVVCTPLRLPARRSLADYASYAWLLFSARPYTMEKYYFPEVGHRLRQLLKAEAFDVIVCDFIYPAGIIPWHLPCPKVLFTHNVEALVWQRHYKVMRNPLWKAACWLEYRSLARAERRYLQEADCVLTVSETDRGFFARLTDPAKITVIPTGVDVDYFRPAPGDEQPNLMVFTGSMDWMPNEDGISYFVRKILPHIHREIPEATLWVVGRRPSDRLKALAHRDDRVRVTGTVEDIRPYLRQGSVYVVPLRSGSGTRLKIFEAMAMGKAVVATPIGAEGLPVEHGKNIIFADVPEEFARGVVRLLRDPRARSELGRAARELVEQKYSWTSVATHFDAILARMARNGTGLLGELPDSHRLSEVAGGMKGGNV